MAQAGEFEDRVSEFEESYEDPAHTVTETFSAELLEQTIEVLEPPVPVCVSPDELVGPVVQGMAARNQGCVLVAEHGVLVGIFTERDVIRRVVGRCDPETTRIRDVMTSDPEAVSFHDTIAVVLNKMAVGGFRRVPLVDIEFRPVGVLTMRDILRYFVDCFPSHVLNVSPNPAVRRPDEVSGAG